MKKIVKACICRFFILYQEKSFQKLSQILFVSPKNSRYIQVFVSFSLPHFPGSKGQLKTGIIMTFELACIN